jgi:hypothetical protein
MKMMSYVWSDPNLDEVKFGDHFVPMEGCSFEDAVEHTRRYVRTQFPRRGKHFDDHVRVHYWDVSEFAKSVDRFRPHSHIDDVIRPVIGKKGKQGVEFHRRNFDDVVIRVNEFLAEQGQPLPVAGLSTLQYNTAVDIVDQINFGKRRILAELSARFGKTIWSGAVADEIDADLIVVASYVHTVFTSFAKDLTSFDQFKNMVHVDTKEDGYEKKIEDALEDGKKVVAYLPTTKGDKRQDRIDFLFDENLFVNRRLLLIDEADYGTHKSGQVAPLKEAIYDDDVLIIMTGTNGDKAVSEWDIDYSMSVTYPEMIISKRMAEVESASI